MIMTIVFHMPYQQKSQANTLRRVTQRLKGLLEKVTGHRRCVPVLKKEAI